jgi:hypothetical protein
VIAPHYETSHLTKWEHDGTTDEHSDTRVEGAKGLTQVQLAKRAKVTRGYLAQLEAGHKMNRRYPRCASSPGRSACR